MSPAKIHALLESLKLSCIRQFRFNPRRIEADMRYKGTEGLGNNLVHVFKDVHSHSLIELKGSMATLREQYGESPHWNEDEIKRYCNTDAEIDAEIAAKQAELEFTRSSALYQDYREQLLSHYKDSPHYQEGRPSARDAAKALLSSLSDAQDPRLSLFSSHMKTNDLDQLSHLLLAPCHIERAAYATKPA
ncbi:hypothetical protein [Undibacterium sp. Ren11W]|uniref:hypothetical protein n=1 Tax=Undibacterium sp. Ren11W TaxID=3413045 RepID=UPI003BF45072